MAARSGRPPVFEPLEARQLLSAAVLGAGIDSFSFDDAQDQPVTVELRGPGQATIDLENGESDGADLGSVRLSNTTAKSALTIDAGGDRPTDVGSILANSAIGTIELNRAQLGEAVRVDGALGRADFGVVAGLRLKAETLGDLTVDSWNGGSIEAYSIDGLRTGGDVTDVQITLAAPDANLPAESPLQNVGINLAGLDGQGGAWWSGSSEGGGAATPGSLEQLHAADVDGDGLDELIGRGGDGQWHAGFAGDDGFSFRDFGAFGGDGALSNVVVGDFNADGMADLAGRSADGGWHVGVSNGDRFRFSDWQATWDPAAAWRHVQAADVNGDGASDVVGQRASSGQWQAAVSNEGAFETRQHGFWGTADWRNVRAADLDGDGDDDLFGRIGTTGETRAILSKDSGGQVRRWSFWGDADWRNVRLGDFTGDGVDDVVARKGDGAWWIAESTADGSNFHRWSESTGAPWTDVVAGDVDGDGRDDLLGRTDDGAWRAALSTGDGFAVERWGSAPAAAASGQPFVMGHFRSAPGRAEAGTATNDSGEAASGDATRLGEMRIGGALTDSTIDVLGGVDRIRVEGAVRGTKLYARRLDRFETGGAMADSLMAAGSAVETFDVGGPMQRSTFTASGDVQETTIGGDMNRSHLMVGASFASDSLQLADATYEPATLDRVEVGGRVVDSIIAAGGDPGDDGLFTDGEVLPGGHIGTLRVEEHVIGANSPHPNPGVYTASIDRLTIAGLELSGKETAAAGAMGTAVIDPLPQADPLSAADVESVVERAATAARNRGVNATISVIDREGNILSAVRTDFAADLNGNPIADAAETVNIDAGGINGLEAVDGIVPTSLIAATKAGTAAFLSTSDGNAFTTRTAGFIIQQHFPPGVDFQDGGPLFGVQLSSLPTSDINRLPLGLSADPGGLPLYQGGELVGAIGVEIDGTYTVDEAPTNQSATVEERVALAGQSTALAPPDRLTADKIWIDGIRLDFAAGSPPDPGSLTAPIDYGAVIAGTPQELIAPQTSPGSKFAATTLNGIPGEVPDASGNATNNGLRDFFNEGAGQLAFQAGAVNNGQRLTAADVETILTQGHRLNDRLRAAIRRDDPKISQVNISVVDQDGALLGTFRRQDAPVFGYDVSVQKARTAAFFSRPDAGQQVRDLDGETDTAALKALGTVGGGVADPYGRHVDALNDVGLTLDGTLAVADRTGGFLSRPNLPDGIDGEGPGPFAAQPPGEFSPFNTGLQTTLILPELVEFLQEFNDVTADSSEANALQMFNDNSFPGLNGTAPLDSNANDTANPDVADRNPGGGLPQRSLANGMQIFAGSVPLYKNGELVGGVGVSGDGIEQDDMVAFAAAGGFLDADAPGYFQEFGDAIRADRMRFDANGARIRLPYVKFPRAPFRGT